jgi:hypothetical protein
MSKKDYITFNLNVEFCVTRDAAPDATAQKRLITTTRSWISEAERLFNTKPKLKIHPEWRWNITGVPASFKNLGEYRRFMDKNFDNIVGDKKTEGALVVLVTDSDLLFTKKAKTTKDDKTYAGYSYFPHCVNPFGRKTGIFMNADVLDSTFAHELGHMLSLKHTFESYVGFKKNCNRDYPKGDKGKGGSKKGSRINLMDYGRGSLAVFLNSCQKERAAKQRRLYMTRKGETNYRKLKGLV